MTNHDNKNGAWHTEKDFCANCGVQVDPKHAEWGYAMNALVKKLIEYLKTYRKSPYYYIKEVEVE